MSDNKQPPRKHFLFSRQKIKKHEGNYVAVIENKVVASGKTAKETFELAKKLIGAQKKIEGIYYIPTKRDFLTALCVFRITK